MSSNAPAQRTPYALATISSFHKVSFPSRSSRGSALILAFTSSTLHTAWFMRRCCSNAMKLASITPESGAIDLNSKAFLKGAARCSVLTRFHASAQQHMHALSFSRHLGLDVSLQLSAQAFGLCNQMAGTGSKSSTSCDGDTDCNRVALDEPPCARHSTADKSEHHG